MPDLAASGGYATEFGSAEATGPGYLMANVSQNATLGRFTVSVRLRSAADAESREHTVAARIVLASEAAGENSEPLALLDVYADDLKPYYQSVQLVYENEHPVPLLATVEYTGAVPLLVGSITIAHDPVPWQSRGLMLVWVTAIGILSCVTYRSMQLPDADTRSSDKFQVAYGSLNVVGLCVMLVAFGRPLSGDTLRYDAEAMRRQIGDIRFDPAANNLLAVRTADEGFLVYGPYICMEPGSYSATFRVRVSDISGTGRIAATAEATAGGGTNLLGSMDITGRESDSRSYENVALAFELLKEAPLEVRLYTTGEGVVWLDQVVVTRVGSSDSR